MYPVNTKFLKYQITTQSKTCLYYSPFFTL